MVQLRPCSAQIRKCCCLWNKKKTKTWITVCPRLFKTKIYIFYVLLSVCSLLWIKKKSVLFFTSFTVWCLSRCRVASKCKRFTQANRFLVSFSNAFKTKYTNKHKTLYGNGRAIAMHAFSFIDDIQVLWMFKMSISCEIEREKCVLVQDISDKHFTNHFYILFYLLIEKHQLYGQRWNNFFFCFVKGENNKRNDICRSRKFSLSWSIRWSIHVSSQSDGWLWLYYLCELQQMRVRSYFFFIHIDRWNCFMSCMLASEFWHKWNKAIIE